MNLLHSSKIELHWWLNGKCARLQLILNLSPG